jgi:Ribbon-helix-helix protein, copG family
MDEQEHGGEEPGFMGLREMAVAYDPSPPRPDLKLVRGREKRSYAREKGGGKMKTSVYLEPSDVRRLGWLSSVEDRSQAEIIRAAIRAYSPRVDAEFELFKGTPQDRGAREKVTAADLDRFQAEIDSMMDGFGQDDSHDVDP